LFAANASHELRSPLTRIRTKLDVTLAKPDVTRADLDQMGASIRQAIDRSAALIESMLMLARAQGPIRREAVALDEISSEVLTDVQRAIADRRLSLSSVLARCTVWGDPFLLEQLVRNVLDNAIRHNIDGGWVDVRTEADGIALLRVANSGALPPGSSVEDLFLPLHRGGSDRMHGDGGFGLGLSIVQAIAEGHGGRVTAERLAAGGLSLELALPRADSSSDAHAEVAAARPALPPRP
jgi:signal transduction histidine kinase